MRGTVFSGLKRVSDPFRYLNSGVSLCNHICAKQEEGERMSLASRTNQLCLKKFVVALSVIGLLRELFLRGFSPKRGWIIWSTLSTYLKRAHLKRLCYQHGRFHNKQHDNNPMCMFHRRLLLNSCLWKTGNTFVRGWMVTPGWRDGCSCCHITELMYLSVMVI